MVEFEKDQGAPT